MIPCTFYKKFQAIWISSAYFFINRNFQAIFADFIKVVVTNSCQSYFYETIAKVDA